MAKKFTMVLFLSLFAALFFSSRFAFSVVDCLSITSSASKEDKDYCRRELQDLENQYAELLAKQKAQQKETGTLKGDVDYLNSQINALKTKIKARSVKIAQLKIDIKEKTGKLENLTRKIEREHESLAQLLRNTNDFDNRNLVYLVLSDGGISDFYSDLESYDSIKQAIKASVDQIRGIKEETETEKKELEKKRDDETDAKDELESAQKKVAQSEAEKKKLLAISKDLESAYQKLAIDKKVKADKIRAALFPLAGTTQKIDFGTALVYANEAQKTFGIDPAFLLAILTKESQLGGNVGSCYVTDPTTGSGVGANTGSPQIRVMHPTRDVPVFLGITEKLKITYSSTRVSCWIPAYSRDGSPFGWGGAMGPAQFIPSTWKLFETRLKNILNHDANPWDPRDAFMASAMYLTDLGAFGASASAQQKAACSYYGTQGSTCVYGRSVMSLKAGLQANIDLLSS